MDYSGHRMNDYEWISQYMDQLGKDKLFEFIDAVYKGFEHMNPGKSINLKTATGITDKNRQYIIPFANESHPQTQNHENDKENA